MAHHNRRPAFRRGIISWLVPIAIVAQAQIALSQTTPDVLFTVDGYLVQSSWYDDDVSDPGPVYCAQIKSGSASATSLTLHSEVIGEGSFPNPGLSCTATSSYQFTVYAKGQPTITVTTTSNGSAEVDPNGGAQVNLPRTSANDISQNGSGSQSTSSSDTRLFNLGCSSTAAADSDGGGYYYGEYYSKPTGYVNALAGAYLGVSQSEVGSSTFNLSAQMDATITVEIGAAAPIAEMTGPTVNGAAKPYPSTGDSITFTNIAYDPDNEQGAVAREGICSAQWTVTRPDGVIENGSNLTGHTFTAGIPGKYTVSMLVTDNEGDTDQIIDSVTVEERVPIPGSTCEPEYCLEDHGRQTCCNVGAGSGNAHCVYRDPVSTRGYPLANNIHVNGQTNFPSRTTLMSNAAFTYGIAVIDGTITRKGVQSNRWYVIDADGAEIDFGPSSAAPAAQPGCYAQLTATANGFTLTNAGPPESIESGGNYEYEFDLDGRLAQLVDPSGNIQELSYSTSGELLEVSDLSSNRSITFEYDTPGAIARVVEGNGEAVIHLTYSSTNGKVTGIAHKDSLGTTVRSVAFSYDTEGRLSTVQHDGEPASAITFSYQDAGSGIYLANLTHASGGSNYNYSVAPPSGVKYRTKKTTAQGGEILYDFDAKHDLIKVTLPTMHGASGPYSVSFTRDSWRNVNVYTYAPATSYTYTYDSLGNVTNIYNSWSGVNRTFSFNGFDLLTASDPLGTYLTQTYTDSANPHSPTTIADGLSRTWTWSYNQYGQVLSISPPTGSPLGATTHSYEETSTDPAFGYLRSITNGAGEVVTFDSYSPLGDVLEETTSPQSGITNTTTYAYDPLRRVTAIEHPDGKTFSYSYNGRNLSGTVDEAGTLHEYEWHPTMGVLTGHSKPLGCELAWAYNGDGGLTEFTDTRSNQTSYTYGLAGELKYAAYPDGGQFEYKYDGYARLTSITTPRGRGMSFGYDVERRLKSVSFSNPSQTGLNFWYRNEDGLVSQTQAWTGTAVYTYTAARQVETVTYNYSNSGLSDAQKLTYTYNPDGSVATLNWKNGSTSVVTWTYSYDGAGRLTGVSNTFGSGQSTTYAYDGEGKIVSQTNSNGTSVHYTYNQARGWPTLIEHKLNGAVFASYALEYDNGANTVGNITKVTELDGSIVNYAYDALYRLTAETRTGTNPFAHTYGYDLAGNVTDLDGSTFATYDVANKFATLSGGTFSYDASGNLKSVSGAGLPSGTFGHETRELLANQDSGGVSIGYNYDVYGKRLLSKPGATASTYTWYIFDGDRLIGEVGTSGPKAAYTWGADGIVSSRIMSGSQNRFYHFGPQGETRQLTDGTGNVVDTYLYTAYGVPHASTGTDYNPHRYGGKVGYYSEGPMGLVLATKRWYSPELMRWMTRDPLEYDGGANLYEYANGNPVTFVDSSGEVPAAILVCLATPACQAAVAGVTVVTVAVVSGAYGKAVEANKRIIRNVVTWCSDNRNDEEAAEEEAREETPWTNKEKYKNVKGTPAKKNIETGEYWVPDKSRHRGPHYEVYKNCKAWEKGHRDRAVYQDGRRVKQKL